MNDGHAGGLFPHLRTTAAKKGPRLSVKIVACRLQAAQRIITTATINANPVFPAKAGIHKDRCLSAAGSSTNYYYGNHKCQSCLSRESGNPCQEWMPDQVRHDNLSHVCLPE
jgi:hypothetical protein